MSSWLDLEQVFEGNEEVIYINLSQFDKKLATRKMYCRKCEKTVKAFPPSACNGNRRKDKKWLFPPRWLNLTTFCAECGWMFKRRAVPAVVKRDVSALDKGECVYCGRGARAGYPLEFDHKTPAILGGDETAENIVLCCYFCNLAKGGKKEWIEPQYGRFAQSEN